MNSKTAFNHLQRLRGAINRIYEDAKCFHPTCDELLAKLKSGVWEDAALKRCPSWVVHCLQERDQIHFHDIQQNWVVWLFECPDGIARPWEALDEATRNSYCAPGRAGKHYWINRESSAGRDRAATGEKFVREYTVTHKPF